MTTKAAEAMKLILKNGNGDSKYAVEINSTVEEGNQGGSVETVSFTHQTLPPVNVAYQYSPAGNLINVSANPNIGTSLEIPEDCNMTSLWGLLIRLSRGEVDLPHHAIYSAMLIDDSFPNIERISTSLSLSRPWMMYSVELSENWEIKVIVLKNQGLSNRMMGALLFNQGHLRYMIVNPEAILLASIIQSIDDSDNDVELTTQTMGPPFDPGGGGGGISFSLMEEVVPMPSSFQSVP